MSVDLIIRSADLIFRSVDLIIRSVDLIIRSVDFIFRSQYIPDLWLCDTSCHCYVIKGGFRLTQRWNVSQKICLHYFLSTSSK